MSSQKESKFCMLLCLQTAGAQVHIQLDAML